MEVITAFESFKHLKSTCLYSIQLVPVFDIHPRTFGIYQGFILGSHGGGVEGAHHLAPWLNFDAFIQTDNRSDGSERKGTAPSFQTDETGNWPPKQRSLPLQEPVNFCDKFPQMPTILFICFLLSYSTKIFGFTSLLE